MQSNFNSGNTLPGNVNGDYVLRGMVSMPKIVYKDSYMLAVKKASGSLVENPIIVKTIVTTDLVKKIAKEYGIEIIEVLTGFKYIGEVISKLEKQGKKNRITCFRQRLFLCNRSFLSSVDPRDNNACI